MNPGIGRDLALSGQPDQVHRRRVSGGGAGAAFERRFQLPDRRIARPADGIERQARAGLAAVAFDLEPAKPAIEALPDGRRWLRWPAKTLHADRPRLGLGAVGFANGFPGGKPCVVGVDFRAPDPAAVDGMAGSCAHGRPITAAFAWTCNATRIRRSEATVHQSLSTGKVGYRWPP